MNTCAIRGAANDGVWPRRLIVAEYQGPPVLLPDRQRLTLRCQMVLGCWRRHVDHLRPISVQGARDTSSHCRPKTFDAPVSNVFCHPCRAAAPVPAHPSSRRTPPAPRGCVRRCRAAGAEQPVQVVMTDPPRSARQRRQRRRLYALHRHRGQRGSSYFSVTSPSPSILPTAVLPGGTNWQATMLPVETIMPFFRVLPCSPSLLASQASAL
jgi:hypothetical protein